QSSQIVIVGKHQIANACHCYTKYKKYYGNEKWTKVEHPFAGKSIYLRCSEKPTVIDPPPIQGLSPFSHLPLGPIRPQGFGYKHVKCLDVGRTISIVIIANVYEPIE